MPICVGQRGLTAPVRLSIIRAEQYRDNGGKTSCCRGENLWP